MPSGVAISCAPLGGGLAHQRLGLRQRRGLVGRRAQLDQADAQHQVMRLQQRVELAGALQRHHLVAAADVRARR